MCRWGGGGGGVGVLRNGGESTKCIQFLLDVSI